jgi:hypothetical protein
MRPLAVVARAAAHRVSLPILLQYVLLSPPGGPYLRKPVERLPLQPKLVVGVGPQLLRVLPLMLPHTLLQTSPLVKQLEDETVDLGVRDGEHALTPEHLLIGFHQLHLV